jgi:hypothetical protein
MASVLAGFRPVKHLTGAPYNGQFNRYSISASEAVALNVGDLVILSNSDAVVDPTGGVYPAVERAGPSNTTPVTAAVIVGAVVGFEPDYSNLNAANYRVGSTARIVFVADAPDLIFAAPQDAVGGVIAATSVGLNVPFVPGVTTTRESAMTLDSSAVATTNTLPLRIVGITAAPDNDVTSTARPAEVLVMVNTHQYANGSTGVA